MKQTIVFGIVSAALALMSASAEVDCAKLSLSVKKAVAAEHSNVLEIVAKEVGAAPGCACEVVKAAIESSNAKPETVAAIVEAAVTAAPDQMRLIAKCAVAVAPDAMNQVQSVIAKLDPNRGDEPNPLDFPVAPGVEIGPNPEGPGGLWLIPIFPPIIINPPDVTPVNP